MKIASYNVNNANKRLAVVLRWLERTTPDVVCFQETKADDHAFPEGAFEHAGYGAVWKGQRSWNGVAILARGTRPIVTRRELPGDPSDAQARYIEAAVRGILVACIYAPNGNPQPGPKFDSKLAWLDRLNRHAKKLLRERVPVLIAGDFNVVPGEADIYPSHSWKDDAVVQPQARKRFRALLAQGWTDALRTMHPDVPNLYTYWDYKRLRWPRDRGMRLDHFLLSPPLVKRLKAAGIDKEVRGEPDSSDHAPAWIELSEASRRSRR